MWTEERLKEGEEDTTNEEEKAALPEGDDPCNDVFDDESDDEVEREGEAEAKEGERDSG